MLHPYCCNLELFFFLTLVGLACALPQNLTIDDTHGDYMTGGLPIYAPSDAWQAGPACYPHTCNVPIKNTYWGGWHEATLKPSETPSQNPTVTLHFNGTAIWIYTILAGEIINATTFVHSQVVLDGAVVQTFLHTPDETDEIIVRPTYANASIPDGPHTIILEAIPDSQGSYLAFDYAVYTVQDLSEDSPSASPSPVTQSSLPPSATSPSSTSKSSASHAPVAAIAGGTVGALILIIAACLIPFCLRKRSRRGLDAIRRARRGRADIDGIDVATVDPFLPERTPDMAHTPLLSPESLSGFERRIFNIEPEIGGLSSSGVRSDLGDSTSTRGSQDHAEKTALLSSLPSVSITGHTKPMALGLATSESPSAPLARTRSQKAAVRQQELAQQVRDMERAVATLRAGMKADKEGRSAEDRLSSQVEVLQLQVGRLKIEQEEQRRIASMLDAPPAYDHGNL